MNLLQRIEWRINKECKRLRLKNKTPSILASNCNGGIICHDLGLPFLSPTINLSFDMNDFVKLMEKPQWYMAQEIIPFEDKRFDYPCGMLADIEIRFNHYETFQEAKEKWDERKRRINWDNLFVLGIDGDNCTSETLRRFDALPYPNKVVFTHISHPEISSSYYIPGFEQEEHVGVLLHFKEQFLIRRYLDDFDYVSFLNKR